LVGSCRPPRPTTTAAVTVRIGAASQGRAIFGDRVMDRGGPSPPAIFAEMPLRWERSFGGPGIPQNPLGCGVAAIEGAAGKRVPLPNIEDPRALISGPGSRPSPVGFAPIHPNWRPRADLVGTYDALWQR